MPKHSTLFAIDPEGIDAIIDSVVVDPKAAAHAKSLLRQKVEAFDSITPFRTPTVAANDDEDMWDNMPV